MNLIFQKKYAPYLTHCQGTEVHYVVPCFREFPCIVFSKPTNSVCFLTTAYWQRQNYALKTSFVLMSHAPTPEYFVSLKGEGRERVNA